MRIPKGYGRTGTLVTSLALLALSVTSCGDPGEAMGTDDGGAEIAATESANAIKLLPADMKSAGTITIAMDATQGKPFTYYDDDNKTMIGLTADLNKALGQALGLDVTTENTSFDNLIPGLQAKRYDLSIAPMLMTDDRLEIVDMIGWLHGGSQFLVTEGGQDDLTPEDTCGMTIGAVTGSVESLALEDQSKKCSSSGQEKINIKLYPRTTDGIVALTSGRLDAYDSAAAQVAYISKSDDRLEESGEPYDSGTSSMALPKGSPASPAVEAALQHLIDTGVYEEILDSYGVDNLAVPSASLNKPV